MGLALGSHRCPTSCGWALLSNLVVPTVENLGADADTNSGLAGHWRHAIVAVGPVADDLHWNLHRQSDLERLVAGGHRRAPHANAVL